MTARLLARCVNAAPEATKQAETKDHGQDNGATSAVKERQYTPITATIHCHDFVAFHGPIWPAATLSESRKAQENGPFLAR
jgi:hypothetical protein